MTRASPLVIARFRASQLPTGGSAGRGAPTWCRAWLGGRVNTRNRPEDRWDPRVVGAPQLQLSSRHELTRWATDRRPV